VIEDLKRAITSLAPPGLDYEHEKAWHDGNGHSHVQAALLGPSIALPIRDGSLKLGTWQQVVAINQVDWIDSINSIISSRPKNPINSTNSTNPTQSMPFATQTIHRHP
jgi:thiamine phosphate synthase YjbQ (UPF0047 family)